MRRHVFSLPSCVLQSGAEQVIKAHGMIQCDHIAIAVDDLNGTLERLKGQGIEPERVPYQVREGGSWLTFVRDPDQYRVEIIGRGL